MFIKKMSDYKREDPRDFSPWDRTPARVTAAGNGSVEEDERGVLVKDHDQKVEWLFWSFSPDSKYYGQYDVGYW